MRHMAASARRQRRPAMRAPLDGAARRDARALLDWLVAHARYLPGARGAL